MDVEDARQKISDFNEELKHVRSSFKAMEAIIGKVSPDIKAYLIIEVDQMLSEISERVKLARQMWVKNEQI